MTCRRIGNAIVCGPPRGIYRRRVMRCPVCERRHRFIERWGGAWYGATFYGACGDSWTDGELGYRPFQRGWRGKAQRKFRDMWQHATTPSLYAAYVSADRAMAMRTRTARQELKRVRRRMVAAELIRRRAA